MHESGYEKKVYLPEPTGGKTPMCCKIALDSDLPFPRSAFLTFPFEAYLDSPGSSLCAIPRQERWAGQMVHVKNTN